MKWYWVFNSCGKLQHWGRFDTDQTIVRFERIFPFRLCETDYSLITVYSLVRFETDNFLQQAPYSHSQFLTSCLGCCEDTIYNSHLRIWKNLRPRRADAANIWLFGPDKTMVEAHIVIISGNTNVKESLRGNSNVEYHQPRRNITNYQSIYSIYATPFWEQSKREQCAWLLHTCPGMGDSYVSCYRVRKK